MTKTRDDFRPDSTPPRSLEDIILGQIHASNGVVTNEIDGVRVDSVNDLLARIYRHIEAEAIRQFRSNELWAIKAWTYDHILQDSVAKEAAATDDTLLDELTAPLAAWQKQEFDPLLNFRRKLQLEERAPGYVKECLRVATTLVSKYGKKQYYTEQELLEFMERERKHLAKSSYVTRLHQLKAFLDSLPENERGQRPKLPIHKIPSYPPIEEMHRPYFTTEEIERLIYWAVLEGKPEFVARLAVATIYGARVNEVAAVCSEHITLDHDNPTISIPTSKRGRRAPQPIPLPLVPIFSIPLKATKDDKVQRGLKRMCKKAGVPVQRRMGIHSIRRAVATALMDDALSLKEVYINRFLRWSEGGGGRLGVLPRYVRTPVAKSDAQILTKHPFVPMWLAMLPFLPLLPQYGCVCNIDKRARIV